MNIKEQFEIMDKLYHITSFDTALKIIESNLLRFGRLNNMNDIHENDKYMFVDATNHILKKKAIRLEEARKIGGAGCIPIIVYGNGLFDYALDTSDGEETFWTSKDGYEILISGENCEIAL